MNFIKKTIKERWHLHFIVGTLLYIFLDTFMCRNMELLDIPIFFRGFIDLFLVFGCAFFWEWFWGIKNGAPFSVTDIIASCLPIVFIFPLLVLYQSNFSSVFDFLFGGISNWFYSNE